jgi:hypothetical protein
MTKIQKIFYLATTYTILQLHKRKYTYIYVYIYRKFKKYIYLLFV